MSHIPDDLLRELLVTFRSEATERLVSANRAMLALEEERDPQRVQELVADIFRELHSLKGASGAVGLTAIQALSHRLETLFENVRSGTRMPREHHDLVYRSLDAIAASLESAQDPDATPPDVSEILEALDGAAVLPTAVPEPVPPSVDDVHPGREPSPEAGRPASISDVRVATSKLDALMGQVGELMAATRASARRAEEIRELHGGLAAWESKWREARPGFRRLFASLSDANGNGVLLSSASAEEVQKLLRFVYECDSHYNAITRSVSDFRQNLGSDARRMDQVVTGLQEEVRRTRLLPLSTVLSAFPRAVRDMARTLDKEATLEIEGGDIEVDRSVLENLKDPITHLLRNAVDHGLEEADDRVRKGKPRRGVIRLSATQKGDGIELEVADDGAGIDVNRVRMTAIKKGVVSDEEAEAMSDREVIDLIFRSGFSTSPLITDLSGRGVGLDVVRDSVERINGTIEVSSETDRGSSFRITVPLSIATTQCLVVRAGHGVFALPVTNVARILRVDSADVGRAGGRDALVVDDRPIPLVRLADVLGVARDEAEPADRQAIVLGSADKRAAFLVDGFEGAQEVVIKALPQPLERVRFAAGGTVTGAGDVVVVLNVADLTRAADGVVGSPAAGEGTRENGPPTRPVVLIVDDSIVTRTLEKNILESAGYEVRVASDGIEAWDMLELMEVDLLVSDIEMPRLDGFGLTERVRADERLSGLPVVLVTSLGTKEHRERGVAVGADAHIVKQGFNQDRLLDTIRSLI